MTQRNRFFGRKALLDRIGELHASNEHVSVVGPRSIGKTSLLDEVVGQHAKGSALFAGAGIVDFRHDPPTSAEAAIQRIAAVLVDIFRSAAGGELRGYADEIDLGANAEELYDQLKITVNMIAEGDQRILLVLDGCDPVLQNDAIPRNLWDNLRALAQARSLRLMTGSRDHLHRLCYNPDSRVSDFFQIFYDEPIVVGPFDDNDWTSVFEGCGLRLDSAAQKALVNWTGGHPSLLEVLLLKVRESARDGVVGKREVDAAAQHVLEKAHARVEALWTECPAETRTDILQLAEGDVPVSQIPQDRVRYLLVRGIASESGKSLHLSNEFVARIASGRRADAIGVRKLFERSEDFAMNIRAVLELRLIQLTGGDVALMKLTARAVRHLPEEPDAVLGSARDIVDRALDLVWAVEAPDGSVPKAWLEAWKYMSGMAATKAIERCTREPTIADDRGAQCDLLRIATGRQGMKPVTAKVSKTVYVLLDHMRQIGDLKNHSRSVPSLTMAVAFCMAAIELVEVLARDLRA